jgi:hypothetical protein
MSVDQHQNMLNIILQTYISQHQFVQNIGLEQKKNQLIYISVSNLSPLTTCLKYLDGFFQLTKCINLTLSCYKDNLTLG